MTRIQSHILSSLNFNLLTYYFIVLLLHSVHKNACQMFSLQLQWEMCWERCKHCACTGCSKVRTMPARHKHTPTHRQDRLQYTVLLA